MSPKYVRKTITVPVELMARMNAVGREVNWSALACRAFENKLNTMVDPKEALAFESVLTKFHAIVENLEKSAYDMSRLKGDYWGRSDATTVELERIHSLREKANREHGGLANWLAIEKPAPWTTAKIICLAIIGAPDDEWLKYEATADRRVSEIFGDVLESQKLLNSEAARRRVEKESLRGFIDGAADFWEGVRDKL